MQSISPETIYRGNSAWKKSLPQITKLTKSPLILGRGIHTKNLRNNISIDLKNQNLKIYDDFKNSEDYRKILNIFEDAKINNIDEN